MDLPILKDMMVKLFSDLIDKDRISLPNLRFYKGDFKDDEDFSPDEVFGLMASLLKNKYEKSKSWKEVKAFYQVNGFQKQFRRIRSLILQDTLFEDDSAWPTDLNPHLQYLMDQDEEDSLKNQEKFDKLV